MIRDLVEQLERAAIRYGLDRTMESGETVREARRALEDFIMERDTFQTRDAVILELVEAIKESSGTYAEKARRCEEAFQRVKSRMVEFKSEESPNKPGFYLVRYQKRMGIAHWDGRGWNNQNIEQWSELPE